MKTVELPIFHLGTYRSANGVPVTFTPELLRQLERNTNFVIGQKALQPPVGYDHPAARDTNAHGRISSVRVDGGKLFASIEGTSDQLREDAKSFRRLTYSPEFHEDFEFVSDGKPVKVGPTVIGLAMLGAQRGAIKNTAMIPLSEVNFGEATPAIEAMILRTELRSLGYLGEYVVDGKFFGEVENDARRFFSEDEMDEKQIAQMVSDAVSKNDEKWEKRFEKFSTDTENKMKQFSEEEKERKQRLDFCESVAKEKPMGKLASEALREFGANPTWENAKKLMLALPSAIAPGGTAGKTTKAEGEQEDGDEGDEPKALAKLRPKHFSDIDSNEQLIADGIVAFSEYRPKEAKDFAKKSVAEQIAAVKQYVTERESASN